MKISKYVWEGSRDGGASEARHGSTVMLRRGSRSQYQCPSWEDKMKMYRTIDHSEPGRMMRDADGVSSQAGVLAGII